MTTPYTYCIKHLPSGKRYYGARWAKNCHPTDLWVTYFTSSSVIKKLIEKDGPESFTYEVRKIFNSRESALYWEQRVLCRLKILKNTNWFNRGYFSKDRLKSILDEDRNRKISQSLTGRINGPMPQATKDKIGKANSGRILPPRTDEHRRKLSETPRKKYPPRTQEHIEKIRAAKQGMKYGPKTEEAKMKISLTRQEKYGYNSKFQE